MVPKPTRKKLILLAALSLTAVVIAAASLLPAMARFRQTYFPTAGMRLGLDLQGGLHLASPIVYEWSIRSERRIQGESLHRLAAGKGGLR